MSRGARVDPLRVATHALVWIAALAFHVVVLLPLLRVLALDLEALIANLVQNWNPTLVHPWWIDRAWIPWGRFLVMFGAAPLVLLVVARWLYALAKRWLELDDPLAGLSRRLRVAVAMLVWLCFITFCWPFLLALGVWIQVEAFWWIEWHDSVMPTLDWIRDVLPLVLLPGLMVLGALGVRPLMREPDAPRVSWYGRAARLAMTIAVLAPLIPALALGGVHASRLPGSQGLDVFEARCDGCHDRVLPLYYIKTPAEWMRTVATQERVEGVTLTDGEREAVIAFLCGMRSYSDAWTTRTRCGRCHVGGVGGEPRTAGEWGAIVDRIARWSPYYYRADVREQVVRHLAASHGAERDEPGRELAQRCAACHSLSHEAERYRSADSAVIAALVARMNDKRHEPLSDAQNHKLSSEYRAVIADPALLESRFPHDRPVVEGGPSR